MPEIAEVESVARVLDSKYIGKKCHHKTCLEPIFFIVPTNLLA